ncbi:MAG: response regulator transcription factor [Humibacter sp.]
MLPEFNDRLQQTLDARTRQELLTAAVHAVGLLAAADGTRAAEIALDPPVAYRVVTNETTGGDPTAAVQVAPLNHPLIAHYVRTRVSGWVSIEDLLPGRLWLEHPLYREVYRPAGLRSQISCAVSDDGGTVVSLSLNRAGADFTDRERSDLTRYLALIQQLWSRADETERSAALVAALQHAVNGAGLLVLAVSSRSEQLYVSEELAALGRSYPDLLDDLVSWAGRAASLSGSVALDPRHALAVETATAGDVTVIRCRPTDPLGLTRREVEVLQAVAAGDTADAIAWSLHLSVGTVHKHLEHVYEKLGVHDKVTAVTVAREHGTIR